MYPADNERIENPDLVRTMRALREDNTSSNRSKMASALMESRLLCPVRNETLFVPAKEPENRLRFEELTNTRGERFYLGFTDLSEYNKWDRKGSHQQIFVMDIEDYGDILVRTLTEVAGFVINPFGENISITKSLLLSLLRQRDEKEETPG